MGRFDPSPEGRARFLRERHKTPLRERAAEVLGQDGPGLLSKLRDAYSEDDHERWTRHILRKCARIDGMQRRRQYAEACIAQQTRIKELLEWLRKHPDPVDVLDDNELREVDPEELKVYNRRIYRAEDELAILTGGENGLALLCESIGSERAWQLVWQLDGARFDPRRMNAILASASRAEVRYPERYVAAVIANERDAHV